MKIQLQTLLYCIFLVMNQLTYTQLLLYLHISFTSVSVSLALFLVHVFPIPLCTSPLLPEFLNFLLFLFSLFVSSPAALSDRGTVVLEAAMTSALSALERVASERSRAEAGCRGCVPCLFQDCGQLSGSCCKYNIIPTSLFILEHL